MSLGAAVATAIAREAVELIARATGRTAEEARDELITATRALRLSPPREAQVDGDEMREAFERAQAKTEPPDEPE